MSRRKYSHSLDCLACISKSVQTRKLETWYRTVVSLQKFHPEEYLQRWQFYSKGSIMLGILWSWIFPNTKCSKGIPILSLWDQRKANTLAFQPNCRFDFQWHSIWSSYHPSLHLDHPWNQTHSLFIHLRHQTCYSLVQDHPRNNFDSRSKLY